MARKYICDKFGGDLPDVGGAEMSLRLDRGKCVELFDLCPVCLSAFHGWLNKKPECVFVPIK